MYTIVFQIFKSSSSSEKAPRPQAVKPCDCQVYSQLPFNIDTGQLEVHHFFTGRGLWNANQRFGDLNLTPGSTIMYPGGNRNGADGRSLMKRCPKW